jgi:hypothetical protein
VEVLGRAADFRLSHCYPNPAADRAHLVLETPAADRIVVTMTNVLGADVLSRDVDVASAGMHDLVLRVDHLPAGLYTCRVTNGRRMATTPLLIAR